MNVLLDSQALIWWLDYHPALNDQSRGILAETNNHVYASAASIWEIAIKYGIGKFPVHPDIVRAGTVASGVDLLNITAAHAVRAAGLAQLADHRNPFDRMFVAQALVEELTLMTADAKIRDYRDLYGVPIIWARR